MADDHPALLERVSALLEPEFDVVGTAANGRDLLSAAKRLQPDVIILDISMPVLDGIETANQLRDSGSQAKVIFLTIHDRTEFVHACFETGALGYVVKSCLTTDLVSCLREVLAGHEFISPALQAQLDQSARNHSQ
jgi:DNA-binding NarL/FixJ family response regulator